MFIHKQQMNVGRHNERVSVGACCRVALLRGSRAQHEREREKENLLGTMYSIPAPILCHRCHFFNSITIRSEKALARSLSHTVSHFLR